MILTGSKRRPARGVGPAFLFPGRCSYGADFSMHKLVIALFAAMIATVGLAMGATESHAGNDGRGGEDRYLGNGYWNDGGYYGGYYGPRYVVRRNYYGGGCYRPKVDAWGNVYYKVRRACR